MLSFQPLGSEPLTFTGTKHFALLNGLDVVGAFGALSVPITRTASLEGLVITADSGAVSFIQEHFGYFEEPPLTFIWAEESPGAPSWVEEVSLSPSWTEEPST